MQEFNNTAINGSANTDCIYFNECYLQVRNNGHCFSKCEDFHPQPYKECDAEMTEYCIRELIREFDNKHPALFADYMREFNNHPISEIIEYMWDMHDLIEDIKYRLPNEGSVESGEEE